MKEAILFCATMLSVLFLVIAGYEFEKYLDYKYSSYSSKTVNELQLKVLNLENRVRFLERILLKKRK